MIRVPGKLPRLGVIGLVLPASVFSCSLLNESGHVYLSSLNPPAACVRFSVDPGHPTELKLVDSRDLAFLVQGPDGSYLRDGFQFGQETLTIVRPGQYRVEVRADASEKTRTGVAVSRSRVDEAAASSRLVLESAQTDSKHSRELTAIKRSLALQEASDDSDETARTYLKAGDAELRAANAGAARIAYRWALELCRGVPDRRCIAEAANNAGVVERQLGDFEAARAMLEEASGLWRQFGAYVNEGKTFSNLGILYSRIGNYQAAIASYDRSRSLLERRDPVGEGRTLNNLGLTYLGIVKQLLELMLPPR